MSIKGDIELVTRERLERTDHYRAQVNIDQLVYAAIYNAFKGYYANRPGGNGAMAHIRNAAAGFIEEYLRKEMAESITARAGFSDYLREYVRTMVDPKDPVLQEEVRSLYHSLGWRG